MRLFRRSRSACRRYDVQLSADRDNYRNEYFYQQQCSQTGERSSSCQGIRDGSSQRVSSSSWRNFTTYRRNHDKDEENDKFLTNCFGLGVADVVVVACRDVTSSDQLTQTDFEFVGGRRHTLQYTPRTSTLPLTVATPGTCLTRPLSPGKINLINKDTPLVAVCTPFLLNTGLQYSLTDTTRPSLEFIRRYLPPIPSRLWNPSFSVNVDAIIKLSEYLLNGTFSLPTIMFLVFDCCYILLCIHICVLCYRRQTDPRRCPSWSIFHWQFTRCMNPSVMWSRKLLWMFRWS